MAQHLFLFFWIVQLALVCDSTSRLSPATQPRKIERDIQMWLADNIENLRTEKYIASRASVNQSLCNLFAFHASFVRGYNFGHSALAGTFTFAQRLLDLSHRDCKDFLKLFKFTDSNAKHVFILFFVIFVDSADIENFNFVLGELANGNG